jgi:hypothetical protein
MPMPHSFRLAAVAAAVLLAACGGSDDEPPAPEETRAQDSRNSFVPVPINAVGTVALNTGYPDYAPGPDNLPSFLPLTVPGVTLPETDRYAGVLDGASYRIEVPKNNWNGKLVMYAHGYVGITNPLVITTPAGLRRHLIEQGYAWAASSYTKNYYDVRAGVEDTNKLANNFVRLVSERGRTVATPTRTYIAGHSMGGHVAAAAVEDETMRTAVNKVRYNGAVPMCGVTGDTELFDYFGGYQMAAQALAGVPRYPNTGWADIAGLVRNALWTAFPSVNPMTGVVTLGTTTPQGDKLREVVKNLTGGERPIFAQGFAHPLQGTVWGTFGGDGTINGILNRSSVDTNRFVYQLDNDAALSTEETQLNSVVQDLTAAPDANRLRRDGLRWIPAVNGEFNVPVVTIHTLGDMYVPFKMTQIYRQRAIAKGNSDWLVQRAIRAPSHCDFTVAEQVSAFSDMVNWAENGTRPQGDDVLTPATVANPNYGCAFSTTPVVGADSASLINVRAALPACTP